MRLIDKIAQKFDGLTARSLVVSEWEETIYFKPMTGEEWDTVNREIGGDATGPRSNAQVIVLKALDSNGVRLFKNDDASVLMEKGFIETTRRVAAAMTAVTPIDDAEKN
jgi:hypothetical protein